MSVSESDLAAECGAREGEGVRVQQAKVGECDILRVRIESEDAAHRIGKPQGRYVTLDCGNVCDLQGREAEQICCALAVEIREMAQRISRKRVSADFSVLVVGLGNADMTADALGAHTVGNLSVTRQLAKEERNLLFDRGVCEIAALAPGVAGQTGMETAELVRGVVQSVRPDVVIAVDALAARSPKRLAATVQLCDSGVQPGSGVGRGKRALNAQTLGVPVMAIGVPTVIRCTTLIADVLADVPTLARPRDEEIRELCVCPKEIDLVVACAGRLLARSLEKAFCI